MKSLKETAERMMATILEIVDDEPESPTAPLSLSDVDVVTDIELKADRRKLIELCW